MKSKSKYLIYFLIVLIILAVIFIGVPLLVNTIIGTPTPKSFALYGKSEGWHNFWAVYLGAIIGSSIPFIILYKTIKANERINNENIQAQRLLTKFKTESENLHNFKCSATQLCDSYSYNRLVKISNTFILDDIMPIDLIHQGFNDIIVAKRHFLMDAIPAKDMINLLDEEQRIYDYYSQILLDLEVVVSYKDLKYDKVLTDIIHDEHASPVLQKIIHDNISSLTMEKKVDWLKSILRKRIDAVDSEFINELWDLISKVYIWERTRITKFMTNGTKQDE